MFRGFRPVLAADAVKFQTLYNVLTGKQHLKDQVFLPSNIFLQWKTKTQPTLLTFQWWHLSFFYSEKTFFFRNQTFHILADFDIKPSFGSHLNPWGGCAWPGRCFCRAVAKFWPFFRKMQRHFFATLRVGMANFQGENVRKELSNFGSFLGLSFFFWLKLLADGEEGLGWGG